MANKSKKDVGKFLVGVGSTTLAILLAKLIFEKISKK